MGLLSTICRIASGFTVVAVASVLQVIILLFLLPSRTARIRSCIVFERLVGHACLWLCGCRVEISGREHLDAGRPAIFVVNHTSIMDLFIGLRFMPYGSVGVVKKEVVYYPFFGQMYLLTGHLRLDRGRHESAVASMRALGDLVRKAKLSIFMSPEGTRSRDGRLLPFKRGLVHLAIQTGLPVVPVVIQGTHEAWRSDSLAVSGGAIKVTVLPAVDTASWTTEASAHAVEEIHRLFREHLPASQQPLPTPAEAAP